MRADVKPSLRSDRSRPSNLGRGRGSTPWRRLLAAWIGWTLCALPGTSVAASLAERVGSAVQAAAAPAVLLRDRGDLDVVAAWAAREGFAGRGGAAALRQRLWTAGVRDFEVRPLTVVARGADPLAAVRATLADPSIRWSRFTRFAVSVLEGGGRTAISVILSRRGARFLPDERAGLLGFELMEGLNHPALFVTRPSGGVDRFDASPAAGGWAVRWDPGSEDGDLLLELVAEGATGPEVVALWRARGGGQSSSSPSAGPVDVGALFPNRDGPPIADPYRDHPPVVAGIDRWIVGAEPPPDRPPSADDARRAEDHLWALVQNARAARGLHRLRRSGPMTAAARQHAGEIARGEPFGHRTSSGTALDRLTAHGVAAARATENVARAAQIAEAHAALMASPAHRRNLLDGTVDEGAVGVVLVREPRGGWSVVASEVFARSLPPGGAERWGELARAGVDATRAKVGLDPLHGREKLNALSERAARSVVDSGTLTLSDEQRADLIRQVRFQFNNVGRVSVDLLVTTDPGRARGLAHALGEEFDELGVGAVTLPEARGGHSEGTPVLVLLFVER